MNWVAEIGSGQLGAPIVGKDGNIYVSGQVDNNLYALDANGHPRWQFRSSAPFLASPVVANDGTIYIGNVDGVFYAISPEGSQRWSLQLDGGVKFSANQGNDGTLIVAANDGVLYAITPSGAIEWQQSLKRPPLATPAISTDGFIFAVAGEYVACFRYDGLLRWRTSFADMGNIGGALVHRTEKVIIISQDQPIVRAISASAGETLWTFSYHQAWGKPSLPAIATDGAVYFSTYKGSHLFSLNPSGTERWVYNDQNSLLRKPPVLDNLKNVYVTNDSLGLISLSSPGEVRWQVPEARGCYSPAFTANQTIYVSGNRKVFAIGQQPSHIGNLEKISGDAQAGCAGSMLPTPLTVLVKDQFDRPFANQIVRFAVVSGGGTLSDTLVQANSQGIASVSWKLGSASLLQTVRVTGATHGQPAVDFDATATISQLRAADKLSFGHVESGVTKHSRLTFSTLNDCPILVKSILLGGADASAFSPSTIGIPGSVTKESPISIDISFTPNRYELHTATMLVFHDQNVQPLTVQLTGEGQCTSPQIKFLSDSLQFAPTAVGDVQSLTLGITNAGCDTLAVNGVQSTLAAFQITGGGTPFILTPGDRRNVVVSFTPLDTVAYTGFLRVSSNDPNTPLASLPLTGSGALPWTVEPGGLNFGATCVSGKTAMQFELCNNTSHELRTTSLLSNNQQFRAEPANSLSIPAHTCKNVTVSFRPETIGEISATLRVSWDAALSLPDLVLPLLGEGVSTQLAGPDTIRFGSIPVGTSAEIDSSFFNHSECDIIITSLSAHGTNSQTFVPAAAKLPLTVGAGKPVQLGASFNARHAGVALSELRIGTQGNTDTLRVILYARVTAPDIEVNTKFTFPISPFCNEVTAFLPVYNHGDDSLRISSLAVNGANAVDFRLGGNRLPVVVPPRDDIDLGITFDPQGSGPRKANLVITSNDPEEPAVTVNLDGRSTSGPDIETDLRTVEFDSVIVDSSLTLPLTIHNECSEPLSIEALSLNRPPFAASLPQTIIAPFGELKVAVTFKPLQALSYVDSLVIRSNDPDESRFAVKLHGAGIAPDIDIEREDSPAPRPAATAAAGKSGASPAGTLADLNFGKTCLQDTARYMIIVHNRGESELEVYELKTDSQYFQLAQTGDFKIPPHGQKRVLMTFTPDANRSFDDVLTVWSNDPDENPYLVPLRGDGVSPELEVQAEGIDAFKRVPMNSTADGWLRIANTGTRCDLEISKVDIEQNNGDESTGFAIVDKGLPYLQPDSSTSIRVRFSPRNEKTYAATLLVLYNDAHDTLTYQLSGIGLGLRAVLEVSTSRIDFGTVPVGDVKCDTQIVYLRNAGTAPLRVSSLKTAGPFQIDIPNYPPAIAPGDSSKPFRICFRPVNAGEQKGTLNITSDDAHRTVDLIGTGDGNPTAASLCLSRLEVSFGRVALRDSSVQLITVTNCNDFTTTIKPIVTSGSEFLATPDSAKLLPNQSFALAVVFKPATLGLRQGWVKLTTQSGRVVADTTIQLHGEAYVKGQPQVIVSPNPFTPNGDGINEHTVFDFSSFDINHPTLKLFNLAGRLIRKLEYHGGLNREFIWNGLDDDGQLIPPGLFIYIIEEDGRKIESGHIVMVR